MDTWAGSRRILLRVEYDGTDFHGFQSQTGLRTVQQELEMALSLLTGEQSRVDSSSRTDAGVHAAGMPVLTRTLTSVPLIGFRRGLSRHLPYDLSIAGAVEVGEDFDVRKSAIGKIYRYRIWNQQLRSSLRHRTHWYVPKRLDLAAMRAAVEPLLGEHDFSAFRSAGCQSKTSVRRLTSIRFEACTDGAVDVVVEGNAFLQNMVRILVGTLVDVGRGYRPVERPAEALRARSRPMAGPTAPPHGLILERVIYAPDPFAC